MKNININWLVLFVIFSLTQPQVYAQWEVTGNNLINPGIFGSNNNFEVLFTTDGINRMKLMETGTTTINNSIMNTSGFLGLHTTEPWSMFHIQGPNNTEWSGNGYREWMHTGTYMMENSDNLFVGMKDEAVVFEYISIALKK